MLDGFCHILRFCAGGGKGFDRLKLTVVREVVEEPLLNRCVADTLLFGIREGLDEGFHLNGVGAEFVADVFFHGVIGQGLVSVFALFRFDLLEGSGGTILLHGQKNLIFVSAGDASLLHEALGDVDGVLLKIVVAIPGHSFLPFLSCLFVFYFVLLLFRSLACDFIIRRLVYNNLHSKILILNDFDLFCLGNDRSCTVLM